MNKLLVLEFNELCPSLLERFINEGHLPNFKKLRDESVLQLTKTDATGEDLNPWVQWVDIHTGVERQEHEIQKLNEGHKYKGKFTWDVLSENLNCKNWICGSMNSAHSDTFKGVFLPDPWNSHIDIKNNKPLETYHAYIASAVQNYSRGNSTSSLSFIKSILKQGVRPTTIMKLAHQLLKEKIDPATKWRRAMLLDLIQFDVFKYHFTKESPDFSTFFSNTVAHYQHHYWKDFEPEKFGLNSSPQEENKDSILIGYKNTDLILGKILQLVPKDYPIMFLTALSQEPYLDAERNYYNIKDPEFLRTEFGITEEFEFHQVMAEQFQLEFKSEDECINVEKELSQYYMDSEKYFNVGSTQLFLITREENLLFVQCRCNKNIDDAATYISERDNTKKSFNHVFYRMNETKAGKHNQVGIYWKRNVISPTNKDGENTVKPSQIHSDILGHYGI